MISEKYIFKKINVGSKQQQGATLATTLVFLLLMTIVSVSATKISILDVLVSGNEQQQMMLFQTTENQLKKMTNIVKLEKTFTATGFTGNVSDNPNQYKFNDTVLASKGITEIITDIPVIYPCERQGMASSLGPAAPPCDLYDFQVRTSGQNSGARDRHHRGAGKMIPNSGSKGSLL